MKIHNLNSYTDVKEVFEFGDKEGEVEAQPSWFLLPAIIDPYANHPVDEKKALDSGVSAVFEVGKALIKTSSALSRLVFIEPSYQFLEEMQGKAGLAGFYMSNELLKDDVLSSNVFMRAAKDNLPIVFDTEKNSLSGLEKVLYYTEEFATHLFLTSAYQPEVINLIDNARKNEILITASTTPWHLEHYPERWDDIRSDTLDLIASGSKNKTEELLPFFLNACKEGHLTLENIATLARLRIEDSFSFPKTENWTIVDLDQGTVILNKM